MSVSAPSTTLALAPRLNALAVMVQGQHDVLVEMQKTKEVFAEYVKESQETIASQAEENKKLKAELASLKQMHAREMAAEQAKEVALNQAHQSQIAVLRSKHASEMAKQSTLIQQRDVKIARLTSRITSLGFTPEITRKVRRTKRKK